MPKLNDKKMINDIRCLALDMINEAGSGHPGIALGAAPILYALYTYHLNFDLSKSDWCSRDRFVLSAGHASALLYATLFCVDEGTFNLNDLKDKILDSLNKQNKALVIINSPLHNPTGYSLTNNEWKELVRFINEDCDNKEVILLNDIAYIDYSYNLDTVKDYFKELDNLNSNALLVICYSCSKTFTIYGMRLGASIILHKDEEVLDELANAYDKSCRTYWSNSNNGAMTSISNVLNDNYNEFIKEKEQ